MTQRVRGAGRSVGWFWLAALTASCGEARTLPHPTRAPDLDGIELPACECENCEEAVEVVSARHTEAPITYDGDAPAGGDHDPCWGTWGVHETPLAPERFVHNLEHGGVALLHNCTTDCEAEVKWIERFTEANELAISTPYAGMNHRFAVVAWGYRLQSDCLDSAATLKFYTDHVDEGPEKLTLPPPEPPASCPD
jgi:Protein of unknown function (DUF3105)